MRGEHNVFAPIVAAGLLLAFAGYLVLSLAIAAERFMPSLNNTRPTLSLVSPELAEPSQRLTRRVILVIADGMRLGAAHSLPYFSFLGREGVDALASSQFPTFSRPNYTTILTGVPPQWSGVRTNAYSAPVPIDSVMDRTRAAGLSAAYATNFSPEIPSMFSFRDPESQELVSDFDDMYDLEWPGGFVTAAHLLLERPYDLIVLLHGAVDAAGHLHGADSDEYRAAARLVDSDLKKALDSVDLSRDTVIVVADHGHTDWGGHGGLEPEVVEVPLIMAGAGIRRGAAISGAQLTDIAPTIAALLGVPAPGHALGRPLVDALILSPEAKKTLDAATELRRVGNGVVIEAHRERAADRVTAKRIWRLPLVAGFVFLALCTLVFATRIGALRVDWRIVAIGVPAFPVTYYALLGVFGQQFSPSAIPDRGDVVRELFHFGLMSTTVHVLASWFALRGRVILRDRLAAANSLTVLGLFLSVLPAAISWAVFPGPFVELPGPSLMVLIPATFIAGACFALASAATIGLEIVIFFARAVDPRVRLRRLERATERERQRLQQDNPSEVS